MVRFSLLVLDREGLLVPFSCPVIWKVLVRDGVVHVRVLLTVVIDLDRRRLGQQVEPGVIVQSPGLISEINSYTFRGPPFLDNNPRTHSSSASQETPRDFPEPANPNWSSHVDGNPRARWAASS